MKKLILTDCDDVLLDYTGAFERYFSLVPKDLSVPRCHYAERYKMSRDNIDSMVKEFSITQEFSKLGPHEDAIKYVRKLHEEHGFIFKVITSCGTNPITIRSRQKNLNNLFGHSIIDIIHLENQEVKVGLINGFKLSSDVWIDDQLKNHIGVELPLQFLMNTVELDMDVCPAIEVKKWKQIYERITC